MFITTPHTVFGIGLDEEQMRFWASLGASLGMSFVVQAGAPEAD